MSDELTTVPTARLHELLAIEAAYTEEHASEAPAATVAAWFNGFRARIAQKDRERRGE